ncbi:DUF4138 domain-containing protein [Carboxylicivirga sp. RSCT41]|uniref:DUF4138 domain-containing protein n=1 Tax=Carboxylicivirga agarovorans TaxID=3417570 RepID=UPI003D325436
MERQIAIVITLLVSINVMAQNHIQISDQSTVHIICPKAVGYVQVGNYSNVLAEAISEFPNLVRIKAVKAFKDTSSLTLICAEQLYAFKVSYSKHCPLQLRLEDYSGDVLNELHEANMSLHKVLNNMNTLKEMTTGLEPIQTTQSNQVELSLDDIRVKEDLLFIRLTIKNHSRLIYKTTAPSFLMCDKKPKKAANVQEYLIEPKRASDTQLWIAPQDKKTMVLVFKSFSIPRHKQIEINLQEETEGYTGRDLRLVFGNKAIIEAKAL